MHSKNQENGENSLRVASFFAGCGGLDLGFKKAGFDIVWANEFDPTIWATFQKNFPETILDKRSITDVASIDIPEKIHGIIGGPPCQSWSEAGKGRGFSDKRGQVFWEYIRIIKDIQPLFFLAENVSGMLMDKHKESFDSILRSFKGIGYNLSVELLNAKYYNVPQDRQRVIIIGYNEKLGKKFVFPKHNMKLLTLRDAIGGLPEATPAKSYNKTNGNELEIPNHEYMTGGFSSIYMSRNRVRAWDDQSFTIQAGGRHAPIHPKAPKMKFISENKRIFVPGKEKLYRRLSVRECARIQTFPDKFEFIYNDVADGYKMIGNAVPVNFAKALAGEIHKDIVSYIMPEYRRTETEFIVSDKIKKHFSGVQRNLKKKYSSKKVRKSA